MCVCFQTGPVDVVLSDCHFSWGQHRQLSSLASSSGQDVDDITNDVTRSWTLFDISLTVQPVSVCVCNSN